MHAVYMPLLNRKLTNPAKIFRVKDIPGRGVLPSPRRQHSLGDTFMHRLRIDNRDSHHPIQDVEGIIINDKCVKEISLFEESKSEQRRIRRINSLRRFNVNGGSDHPGVPSTSGIDSPVVGTSAHPSPVLDSRQMRNGAILRHSKSKIFKPAPPQLPGPEKKGFGLFAKFKQATSKLVVSKNKLDWFNRDFDITSANISIKNINPRIITAEYIASIDSNFCIAEIMVSPKMVRLRELIQRVYDRYKWMVKIGYTPAQLLDGKPILPTSPFHRPWSRYLFEGIKTGDVNTVERLLKSDPLLVHDFDDIGMTPLHWAAKKGHHDIAKDLVNKKALVNACDILKRSPLYFAIESKSEKVLSLLLAAGSELWPRNPSHSYRKMLEDSNEMYMILYNYRRQMYLNSIRSKNYQGAVSLDTAPPPEVVRAKMSITKLSNDDKQAIAQHRMRRASTIRHEASQGV